LDALEVSEVYSRTTKMRKALAFLFGGRLD
jgi:hypothetical protein